MKRSAFLGVVLMLLTLVPGGAGAGSRDPKILEFDTMVGVVGPFVGAANPIRGAGGGGLPWAIAEGKGELRVDGRLEIRVRGLVLAAGANIGTNPVAFFRGLVSCLADGGSGVATVNVSTGDFPATSTGDADIEAMVVLPSPCIAPIIFVTNPAGRWFAVTGF